VEVNRTEPSLSIRVPWSGGDEQEPTLVLFSRLKEAIRFLMAQMVLRGKRIEKGNEKGEGDGF